MRKHRQSTWKMEGAVAGDIGRPKRWSQKMKVKQDLFDRIAPYYGLFFSMQKRNYREILQENLHHLNLAPGSAVLDVGCGTGAFCAVLHDFGFQVTGIDPAGRMLDTAKKHNRNTDIQFMQGSVLAGLPFAENAFDCVLASYVAHGFKRKERLIMYREMWRVSRNLILVHDFNQKSSPLVYWIERLERSDYQNFQRQAECEMRQAFNGIRVVQVSSRASWYIGEKK